MNKNFVLKGNIITSESKNTLKAVKNSYLVCEDGVITGVYQTLPEKYNNLEILDYNDKIIIPAMTDLHIHAPQYAFRSLGMDLELLDWLNTYTFPEESKYSDLCYAENAYKNFVNALSKSSTSRACVFATMHNKATEILMDMLDKTGLITLVGKVNMNRNSIETLCEKDAKTSIEDTKSWIDNVKHLKNCKPILTPRFTPSCTDDLMSMLGELKNKTGLGMQSHLDENKGEIEWVKSLCPDAENYADTYYKAGLLGENSVLAHCVYCDDNEIELLKRTKTYIAHCPQSNMNLASGIAPIRYYLDNGLNMGLGSDIAGGANISMFRAITDAIGMSKLYWRIIDENTKPLCFAESFYLATAGGGSFFGKVGKLESGFACDVLVLDDSSLENREGLSLTDRLERIAYQLEDKAIYAKFVNGNNII